MSVTLIDKPAVETPEPKIKVTVELPENIFKLLTNFAQLHNKDPAEYISRYVGAVVPIFIEYELSDLSEVKHCNLLNMENIREAYNIEI